MAVVDLSAWLSHRDVFPGHGRELLPATVIIAMASVSRIAVVLVEGITDRFALEAVAVRLGLDVKGVEIVPIGGAQAVRRAAAEYEGERVVGLCDAGEERFFRRVLGDATYVCVKDIRTSSFAPSASPASRSSSTRKPSSRRSVTSRTSRRGVAARRRRGCRAGSSRPTAAATGTCRFSSRCSSRTRSPRRSQACFGLPRFSPAA